MILEGRGPFWGDLAFSCGMLILVLGKMVRQEMEVTLVDYPKSSFHHRENR